MVAAAVAAELPELVAGVILEDPPFDTMGARIGETIFLSHFQGLAPFAGSSSPIADIARGLAQVALVDPTTGQTRRLGDVRDAAALRFSAACLKQVDPAVLAPIVAGHWLNGYDLDRVAQQLRAPALFLQADTAAGGMLISSDLARIQRHAPHIDVVTLPGVGHTIHWSRPDQLLSLAHAFLESL
jgi:pimeloyl-ACP methyl ester carboxylesterase